MNEIETLKDLFNGFTVEIEESDDTNDQAVKDYRNLKYKFIHVFSDAFWNKSNIAFENRRNINFHPTIIPGHATYQILQRYLLARKGLFLDPVEDIEIANTDGFYLHSPRWFKDNIYLYFTIYGTMNEKRFVIVLKKVKYYGEPDYIDNKNLIAERVWEVPRANSIHHYFQGLLWMI